MKKIKFLIILLLSNLICGTHLYACEYTEKSVSERLLSIIGMPPQKMREFLVSLKDAVSNNDAQKFATLLKYPTYWYGEEHVRIDSREQFIESYDKFVTDSIKKVIRETEFCDLFVNQYGVMMGSGRIWVWGDEYLLGIGTINPDTAECSRNCHIDCIHCKYAEPGVCQEYEVIHCN